MLGGWFAVAPRRPASRQKSAVTLSAQPVSPPIYPTVVRLNTLRKWRLTKVRAPPSYMTGRNSASRRMKLKGSGSEVTLSAVQWGLPVTLKLRYYTNLDNILASTGGIPGGRCHLHQVQRGPPCSMLSEMHGTVRDETRPERRGPRTSGFQVGLTRLHSSSLRSQQTSLPRPFQEQKRSESPKDDCDPCTVQLVKNQRDLLTSAEH